MLGTWEMSARLLGMLRSVRKLRGRLPMKTTVNRCLSDWHKLSRKRRRRNGALTEGTFATTAPTIHGGFGAGTALGRKLEVRGRESNQPLPTLDHHGGSGKPLPLFRGVPSMFGNLRVKVRLFRIQTGLSAGLVPMIHDSE